MTLDDELRQLMQELTDEEAADLLSAVSAPVDPDAEARIRRSVLEKRLSAAEPPVIRHRFRILAAAAAVVCPIVLSVAAVYLFSKKPQTPPVLPEDPAVTANDTVQTDASRSETAPPDGTVYTTAVTAQTTVEIIARSESLSDLTASGSTAATSVDPGSAAFLHTTSQTVSQTVSETVSQTTVSRTKTTSATPTVSQSTESAVRTSGSTVTTTVKTSLTRQSSLTTTTTAAAGKGGDQREEGNGGPHSEKGGGKDEGDGPGGVVAPEETTTTTTTTAPSDPWHRH